MHPSRQMRGLLLMYVEDLSEERPAKFSPYDASAKPHHSYLKFPRDYPLNQKPGSNSKCNPGDIPNKMFNISKLSHRYIGNTGTREYLSVIQSNSLPSRLSGKKADDCVVRRLRVVVRIEEQGVVGRAPRVLVRRE